jgi:predicted Fe-Mo cluster-binding NifX family protein
MLLASYFTEMSKTTKIAIPEWQGQVSTVFDFASKMLLIEIDGQKETSRIENLLPAEPMLPRAAKLINSDVDVLICGAISQPLELMISGSGINVISDISGSIDEVLNGYLTGRLAEERFSIPGCQGRGRKGFRGRGRRFQGRGRGRRRCRREY